MDRPWKPVDFKLNPVYQIPTYLGTHCSILSIPRYLEVPILKPSRCLYTSPKGIRSYLVGSLSFILEWDYITPLCTHITP